MKVEELIDYLKESLYIFDPETGTSIDDDPEWIAIPDKHLEKVLQVAISNVDSRKSIDNITQEDLYPVMLLARKEIYYVLATKNAPLYDLSIAGTAGSSSVSRDQRFQHYMLLIAEVNKEYKNYLSTGITLQSVDVTLDNRYFSPRSYLLAKKPYISLRADNIYPKEVELSWRNISAKRFKEYKIYINEESTVIDEYSSKLVKESATELIKIIDFHRRQYRVENLKPSTSYTIAIVIEEMNGLKGYSEIEILTLD